ncbi:MAG: alpha/beta fold hydrolase [Gemmatimonadales bacterium]
MTRRVLVISGLRMSVQDTGSGPAVLLAHGMWCNSRMFEAMTAALQSRFRVVTPDLRAHGETQVPDTPWTVMDLADDLVRLLDALGIERATVAGFSMGGMAALQLALRSPDRLDALALLSTTAAAEERLRYLQIKGLEIMLSTGILRRHLAEEASRWMFASDFRTLHRSTVRRWIEDVGAMPTSAVLQALEAVGRRPDVMDRLGEIRVPVLVSAGDADPIIPRADAGLMVQRLPDPTLRIFPGAGHATPIERPAELAAEITNLASSTA